MCIRDRCTLLPQHVCGDPRTVGYEFRDIGARKAVRDTAELEASALSLSLIHIWDGARMLQAAQEVHHGVVDRDHGTGDAEHNETDDEGREERVEEDRCV